MVGILAAWPIVWFDMQSNLQPRDGYQAGSLRKSIGVAILALVLVAVAYLPSMGGPWVSDDATHVRSNASLRAIPLTEPWRFFVTRTNTMEYLPVRDVSFRLDLALFGLEPRGFRRHNLGLYLLCCALVWGLTYSLVRPGPERRSGAGASRGRERAGWLATAATALFAAHPAHVESVAWISGRKDLLSGAFAIASIWLFVTSLGRDRIDRPRQAAACFLFVLALLSKSTVLPVVLVALLVALEQAMRSDGGLRLGYLARAVGPLALLAVGGLVLHVVVGEQTGVLRAGGTSGTSSPWSVPLRVLGYLTRITLFPVHLRLFYDVDEPGLPWVLSSALAVGAIVATVIAVRGYLLRGSVALLGVGVFTAFSLPFLQLIQFETWSFASERFLFLPLWGAAMGVACLFGSQPRLGRVVLPALFLLLLLGTASRSHEWGSKETLLEKNVRYAPQLLIPASWYIYEVLLPGNRYDEARQAVRRLEGSSGQETLLAFVDASEAIHLGNRSDAARSAARMLGGVSGHPASFQVRAANLALEAGLAAQVIPVYRALLREYPSSIMIPYNLGLAFMKLGELEAAEQNIRIALDNGFEEADAWNNLGLVCRDRGKIEDAEIAFLEALEAEPQHWHAAYNLARLYIRRDRMDEAREMLNRAKERAALAGDDTAVVDALLGRLSEPQSPVAAGEGGS